MSDDVETSTSREGASRAMNAARERTGGSGPALPEPRSWSALTIATWAFCLLVTASLLWSPYVAFGYPNRSLHLVLDSVDGCVALLVAYLLHNRYVRRRRLQDWLLCQGLILLGIAGIGISLVVEDLAGIRDGRFNVWLPLAVRVTGAVVVLAAALVDDRAGPRWLRRWSLAAPVLSVGVIAAVLWWTGDALPVALAEDFTRDAALAPVLAGHPVLLAGQAVGLACFLTASVLLTVQSARRRDELLRWLAPACALAGFARLNYLLYPSLYTDWLYTGDVLRTASYILMLVGALRELQLYWRAQTQLAVIEDRRRLARELHDGVMQELAYIRVESSMLPGEVASGGRINDAAVRALDEARAAVNALGRLDDEPLGFVLHRTARELAERHDVDLQVDVDDSILTGSDQRHALVRIMREAVTNAVRHGRARHIRVRLARDGEQRRLTVADDGSGFTVGTAATSTGYGLVSMGDRARGLPGRLDLESSTGNGTTVTVTW